MNFTREEFIKTMDNSSDAELIELAFDAQRDITAECYLPTSADDWRNAMMRRDLVKAEILERISIHKMDYNPVKK